MKTCPYCAVDNRDDTLQCINCKRDLGTQSFQTVPQTAPTQPVRVSPPLQPPAYPPLPVDPYPPAGPPAAPPPTEDIFPGRFWPLLLFSLAGVFLCVCVLAALTLSTLNGSRRPAAQVPIPANLDSTPTLPAWLDPPSPWPTFTPQPQPTQPIPSAPTPPSPTQSAEIDKLLSPECAGALERLGSLSSQVSSQPSVLLDANWRSGFTQAISDMRTSCGSLDSASPVPGLVSEAQRNLSRASTEFDQATRFFNEGVQNWNPAQIIQAGQHIQQATHYLSQAITALHQIGR